MEREKKNILLSKNKKKEHFTQIKICILWQKKFKAQNVVHGKNTAPKKRTFHSAKRTFHSAKGTFYSDMQTCKAL